MSDVIELDPRDGPATDAQRLAQLISDISEDCWCAGWLDGCEHSLWDMVTGDNPEREWGMGKVDQDDIAELYDAAVRAMAAEALKLHDARVDRPFTAEEIARWQEEDRVYAGVPWEQRMTGVNDSRAMERQMRWRLGLKP